MINFSDYSGSQIVDFVDENFSLFASDRAEGFPENIRRGLSGDLFKGITRKEGFAFVSMGLSPFLTMPEQNADLMFLYVQPEFEGKGIGAALVEEAKRCLKPGRKMDASCEGLKRLRYFERLGFVLVEHDVGVDLYHIQWSPKKAEGQV